MKCAICEHEPTEQAHVKSRHEFRQKKQKNDREENLIPLCHHCHYDFDCGKIALFMEPNGFTTFIRLTESNQIKIINTKYRLNIKSEYVKWKNQQCEGRVKFQMINYKKDIHETTSFNR